MYKEYVRVFAYALANFIRYSKTIQEVKALPYFVHELSDERYHSLRLNILKLIYGIFKVKVIITVLFKTFLIGHCTVSQELQNLASKRQYIFSDNAKCAGGSLECK